MLRPFPRKGYSQIFAIIRSIRHASVQNVQNVKIFPISLPDRDSRGGRGERYGADTNSGPQTGALPSEISTRNMRITSLSRLSGKYS